MRIVIYGMVLAVIMGVQAMGNDMTRSAHDFTFTSIDGVPLPMSQFRGKVILVVNTASFCGFTKQYATLQSVWERYSGRGFVVLGVPSNDFGGQEPGSDSDIKEFCELNYEIDFPMSAKVHVKGSEAHPFYNWAATELGMIARPRWNFHKYLVDADGQLVDWFSSPTSPLSKRVISAIEKHLPLGVGGTI